MSIIHNQNHPGPHHHHQPGIIPLKDSTNTVKNLHNFVNIKKSKSLHKSANSELGFEHHHDVINDHDYYRKIFDTNAYAQYAKMPVEGSLTSLDRGMSGRKMDDSSKSSEEQVQSTTTSIISAPMTGSLTTKELEASLGKYATKKLGRKVKSKDGIWQEEFYIIKMKWLVKLAKVQSEEHKYNLNNFRITIEKIIEEAAPAFEINLFQNQKKVARGLKKLSHFLAKLDPQKAILLSYKLFKIHLKQLDVTNPQVKQEIASKFHNLFLPYIKLMEIKEIHPKEKTQKNRVNLMTYKKIKKFSQKHFILAILKEYPDIKKSPEYAEKFKAFLRERVSLDQALSELTLQNSSNPIMIDRSLFLDANTMRRSQSNICPPSHLAERKRSDNSFEDAKSFELSEERVNNNINLESYILTNPSLMKGKSMNPNSNNNNDNSDDSSNENNRVDSSKTESELMEDPDLYEQNPGQASNKLRDDHDMIAGAERNLPKLRLEGTTSVISPNEAGQRGNLNQHGTHFREPMFCCEDANIAADPQRVSERPEIVRLNSYDNLVSHEPMSNKNQEVMVSPAQTGNNNDPNALKSSRRPSAVRKSMSMSKTKKEILFQKVLSIAYDNVSKWEKVIDNNLIKIEKIKPENSPVVLLRAWATIDGFNPREVFEQIYNTEKRCKWDNVTAYMTTVESIDDGSDIIHFVIKTPFGITERDFLQRRDYIMDYPEPGTITMSFQSCLHPAMPPTKNRIRGETHIAGYIIKPSLTKPGSTELCVLTQCDIKGKVPKTIVNMVASRAPADWVNKLRKACEKSRRESD